MIYLDNAATTYPKPTAVYSAWSGAIRAYGANPGRGGYGFAERTSEAVYNSRERCAAFFGAQPENTSFTVNCTTSLNYAIKGLARRGVHYVISDLEHNAVLRPVHSAAAEHGGSYSIFEVSEEDSVTLARAERAIRPNTAALICTAASNVTGQRLPIKQLAELCRAHNICFVVDGAQGGGVLPLSLSEGINILCCAGHKGLYGPMGTGLLITDGKYRLKTLIEGGTGSASESPLQPEFTPDRFESGTINTAGAIALGAGVAFVERLTTPVILKHELALCRQLCGELRGQKRVTLYNDLTEKSGYAPVVSFNVEGMTAADTSAALWERGFCLRGGLHCAPLAHKKLGTLQTGGTVRFSPSAFTMPADVTALSHAVRKL